MLFRAMCILGVLGANALAQDPSATRPTTRQLDSAQQRQIEQLEAAREAADLPTVKVEQIEQIVEFQIEDGFLTARTSIDAIDGEVRALTDLLPGLVRVRVHDLQPLADDDEGRNFYVHQNDLTGPGQVMTHIAATAGRLIVARDSETEQEQSSIQLIQDPPVDPNAPDVNIGVEPLSQPVRLMVRRHSESGAKPEVDVTLGAPSFVELRRRHPREVEMYLRPILRDYGQDRKLFAVDPRVAWQVLGANYTPDEQMVQRVRTILGKFDAEDFQQRQSAAAELKQLGQPAVVVLSRIDHGTLTPQQQTGVETFLAEYQQLENVDVERLRSSVDFLLDTLDGEDAALRKLAWEQFQRIHPHVQSPYDPNAPLDQRERQLGAIRSKLLPRAGTATTKPQ
jgi:hypothetical protein